MKSLETFMSPGYCWMLQHLCSYKENKGWQRSFLLYTLFYCRGWSPEIRVRGGDRVCKCQPRVHHITTFCTAQRQKTAGFSSGPYVFSVGKSVMDKPVPTCSKMSRKKHSGIGMTGQGQGPLGFALFFCRDWSLGVAIMWDNLYFLRALWVAHSHSKSRDQCSLLLWGLLPRVQLR